MRAIAHTKSAQVLVHENTVFNYLGPIQQKWVEDLISYPERQIDNILGRKENDGTIRVCCLGQALLSFCEVSEISPNFIPSESDQCYSDFVEFWLKDFGDDSCYDEDILINSYQKIGLHDERGSVLYEKSFSYNGCIYPDLAGANDGGVPWKIIAEFIINNPKAVFNESL